MTLAPNPSRVKLTRAAAGLGSVRVISVLSPALRFVLTPPTLSEVEVVRNLPLAFTPTASLVDMLGPPLGVTGTVRTPCTPRPAGAAPPPASPHLRLRPRGLHHLEPPQHVVAHEWPARP